MASEPTVACIMLTRDRPELARRAVECFRAQSYERKRLIIVDSSPCKPPLGLCDDEITFHYWRPSMRDRSIGLLRNYAVDEHVDEEIVVHLDDDDWHHPNRISEQVALLQSSGAEAVGYREALFWRRTEMHEKHWAPGAAWLYSSPSPRYVIGGTLAYWRSTWERRPFPDLPKRNAAGQMGSGEDVVWQREAQCVGVSALCDEPRFVGRIHGSNTMPYAVEAHLDSWRRVPQWDERLREIMSL